MGLHSKSGNMHPNIIYINKGIGDAGSTADLRMLCTAIVCLGLL